MNNATKITLHSPQEIFFGKTVFIYLYTFNTKLLTLRMKAKVLYIVFAAAVILVASCVPHRTCPTYTKNTETVVKHS